MLRIAAIGTEYLLFGGAALLSLLAFTALILVPAIGAFGRTWEKATAILLSFFVLAALLLLGIALGVSDRLLLGRHQRTVRIGASNLSPVSSKAAKPKAAKPKGDATLTALSEAIESGAGLPAVARAAAKVLGASVALIDRSSSVLAVAAASEAEEKKLLSGGDDVASTTLRVADAPVGELRHRSRDGEPDPALMRMVATLVALELERSRAPEWATDEAAGEFVRAVLARDVTDRGDIVARAAELEADLESGCGVVIARAHPRAAQTGEWRARVLTVSLRALRAAGPGALAALSGADEGERAEIAAIVPAGDDSGLGRAARALLVEFGETLSGFQVTVARSRLTQDPVDIYRAGKEATLAVNVAEAEGIELLSFEDTGAYRLLLPAMSEDAAELERFYEETVAPLAAYDEQYETDLVATIEAYLENDGNVTPTAETLFTHRHTIRYRLERVKELSGHDISSTEGREKLSLGLKSMRVLGIAPPRGPAQEPGAEGGKVRQTPKEDCRHARPRRIRSLELRARRRSTKTRCGRSGSRC